MDALLFGGVHASFYSLSLLRHDLTLSVSEPDNAAAKQGQELRSEQTVTPLHEQSPATYFLRLNNLETFVELVGATLLHLLSQIVLPLKSPTGTSLLQCVCISEVILLGRARPKPCLERTRRNCVNLTQFLPL